MGLDVYVHDDKVTLDLSGLDRLWCLAGHLEVPTAHITGARVVPVDEVKEGLGWRVGGAYWPHLIATGWFSVPEHKGGRQFWCVYRDTEVVVVDTDLDVPARLVFQHPDRDRLAWLIGERAGAPAPA